MGNISISIKRFLGNKNTVTILGVIVGIIVLYVGYNWRVNQAVEPQTVPFAKKELVSNTLITNDLVSTIKVSKSMVDQTPNLITSSSQVIGKYVKVSFTNLVNLTSIVKNTFCRSSFSGIDMSHDTNITNFI